jgi:emp24/gp25L/p24 family/GOLD
MVLLLLSGDCFHFTAFFFSELVTMSVFILSGPELKATIQFNGPVAANVESGIELQQAVEKFDSGRETGEQVLNILETVNFEHLVLQDQDEEGIALPHPHADETVEERKERRALERKKALEARQRRDQLKQQQQRKVREEGEPYQKTVKVDKAGWYRFCVQANWFQVVAEVDLRKQSDYGLNDEGDVMTWEEKIGVEEDTFMEEDTAAQEGIKDEDFQSTKDKLKTLRRLLADIQSKQQQERHRLIVHAATNEHSHSRMVLSSLLETVLFMAVTSFQVYTIRRWFKGAPVLGR